MEKVQRLNGSGRYSGRYNVRLETILSQAPKAKAMEKVQRLDGSGPRL